MRVFSRHEQLVRCFRIKDSIQPCFQQFQSGAFDGGFILPGKRDERKIGSLNIDQTY